MFKSGHVLTVEPGCYYIPELIKSWKSNIKFGEFLNYNKIQTYLDFGEIRIEDSILITSDGNKLLGKPIPKTISDIESVCS